MSAWQQLVMTQRSACMKTSRYAIQGHDIKLNSLTLDLCLVIPQYRDCGYILQNLITGIWN